MITYTVELGERSYPILIGLGSLDSLGQIVKEQTPTRVLVCTNTTVAPLYLSRVLKVLQGTLPETPVGAVELPDGEEFKDLDRIEAILMAAAENGLDRRSLIVALGGGVIGDMSGLAASLWMRGIRFVQVPTTLLAQVDSSVGGKTGVNLRAGKNLVGAFYQPKAVVIDPDVLRTLPDRQISAGIAEIIKYGFLGDGAFVRYLEENMERLRALDASVVEQVVARCCSMKADIVRADEKETGVRAKLNLGHTFAHAIEKLTGFSTWLHGEAVGVGCVMAAKLSQEVGTLNAEDVLRVEELTRRSGLPTNIAGLSCEQAYLAMQADKKSVGGTIRFVLMNGLGESYVTPVPKEIVMRVMRKAGWV